MKLNNKSIDVLVMAGGKRVERANSAASSVKVCAPEKSNRSKWKAEDIEMHRASKGQISYWRPKPRASAKIWAASPYRPLPARLSPRCDIARSVAILQFRSRND